MAPSASTGHKFRNVRAMTTDEAQFPLYVALHSAVGLGFNPTYSLKAPSIRRTTLSSTFHLLPEATALEGPQTTQTHSQVIWMTIVTEY